MSIKMIAGGALLLLTVTACETEPYDASVHRRSDASTGSMLSGVDTGADGNGINNNPSIRGMNSGGGVHGGN